MGRNGEEKRNGKKEVTRAARSAVLRYFRCIERGSRIFARSTGTNWKTIVSGITMAYDENVNVDTTVTRNRFCSRQLRFSRAEISSHAIIYGKWIRGLSGTLSYGYRLCLKRCTLKRKTEATTKDR